MNCKRVIIPTMSLEAPQQSPGLLPFTWRHWLTPLLVLLVLLSSVVADQLSATAEIVVHAAVLVVSILAFHEVYARYRAEF